MVEELPRGQDNTHYCSFTPCNSTLLLCIRKTIKIITPQILCYLCVSQGIKSERASHVQMGFIPVKTKVVTLIRHVIYHLPTPMVLGLCQPYQKVRNLLLTLAI